MAIAGSQPRSDSASPTGGRKPGVLPDSSGRDRPPKAGQDRENAKGEETYGGTSRQEITAPLHPAHTGKQRARPGLADAVGTRGAPAQNARADDRRWAEGASAADGASGPTVAVSRNRARLRTKRGRRRRRGEKEREEQAPQRDGRQGQGPSSPPERGRSEKGGLSGRRGRPAGAQTASRQNWQLAALLQGRGQLWFLTAPAEAPQGGSIGPSEIAAAERPPASARRQWALARFVRPLPCPRGA